MSKKEIFRLNEIVGSLMISQFKGNQEEYRKVINTIFKEFFKLSLKDFKKYYWGNESE